MQLTLGDVSVKDLSIKSQMLTQRMKMGMNGDNAALVSQWEAGSVDLKDGQEPQTQHRAGQQKPQQRSCGLHSSILTSSCPHLNHGITCSTFKNLRELQIDLCPC